ncbi:MAG: putative porin [Prevotella sp.]|nr:putative porin [Candidatus Equicola stercoris]
MKHSALRLIICCLSTALSITASAQVGAYTENMPVDEYGNLIDNNVFGNDSTKHHNEEIPLGMHVWKVNRFGDVIPTTPDTLPHTYRNTIFTEGYRGDYNTLGNSGSPRINRIFADRRTNGDFIFIHPYDFFVQSPTEFHFTNTFSPITNLSYNSCGNKQDGEDNLKALFAINVNKRLGGGFKFEYLYDRGYYANQSTSHFQFSPWLSYLGDRYEMHFLFSTNNQKVSENGGILDDNYITHPENYSSFNENEIPVALSQNWNRNKNQHIFFTHRYKVGFRKKVPMTEEEIKMRKFAIASKKEHERQEREEQLRKEGINTDVPIIEARPDDAKIMGNLPEEGNKDNDRIKVDDSNIDSLKNITTVGEDTTWMKDIFVPVTSFIHTLDWNFYDRIYQAYASPRDYYLNPPRYRAETDSIFDSTQHYNVKNTFAIALLEGFNKYAKAGLKIFASHELRHFALPDETAHQHSYNENSLNIGAQISKTQGRTLHFDIIGDLAIAGDYAGEFSVMGQGDLNFRLWNDSVQFVARASVENRLPSFYYRRYYSKFFAWENSLDKEMHTKIEGEFGINRTRTRLRVAVDNITNYTYLAQSYMRSTDGQKATNVWVEQASNNISVFTLQLLQDFRLGILNWENALTLQKSTDDDALPLPTFNAYSNLYINFNIRKVLDINFGFDVRYFTEYYAPDYSPALGSFTTQNGDNRVKTGNYPWINVYADFFLKHARFFVMYSHVNKGMFNKNYFLTPHYPTNSAVLRFGVSWNFFN